MNGKKRLKELDVLGFLLFCFGGVHPVVLVGYYTQELVLVVLRSHIEYQRSNLG